MGLLENLGGMLQQYANADPSQPPADVHQHFDDVANSAPKDSLSGALSAAFRSGQTPAFGSMLGNLFQHSDPNQRAGILNTLMHSAGAAGLGGLLGNLGLGGGQVTPQQAQNVPPEAVEKMASEAEKHDPSIVDRASQFYSEHPTLVKTLGAAALTVALSHMANQRQRG